jgi:hypothetical protein
VVTVGVDNLWRGFLGAGHVVVDGLEEWGQLGIPHSADLQTSNEVPWVELQGLIVL